MYRENYNSKYNSKIYKILKQNFKTKFQNFMRIREVRGERVQSKIRKGLYDAESTRCHKFSTISLFVKNPYFFSFIINVGNSSML